MVLGMLPYQLAGYGSFTPRLVETLMAKCGLMPEGDLSWFNFSWASRIYSSASFGVAILLAAGTEWVAEAVSQAARKGGGPGYHRFHGGFPRGIELGLERGSGNPQRSHTESGQSGSRSEIRHEFCVSGSQLFAQARGGHSQGERFARTDRDALRGSYSVCVARLSLRISLARPCLPTGGSHARGIFEPRPEARRTGPTRKSTPVQEVGAGVGPSGQRLPPKMVQFLRASRGEGLNTSRPISGGSRLGQPRSHPRRDSLATHGRQV